MLRFECQQKDIELDAKYDPGNQWRLIKVSVNQMWSDFFFHVVRHAASFCISCSLSIKYSGHRRGWSCCLALRWHMPGLAFQQQQLWDIVWDFVIRHSHCNITICLSFYFLLVSECLELQTEANYCHYNLITLWPSFGILSWKQHHFNIIFMCLSFSWNSLMPML